MSIAPKDTLSEKAKTGAKMASPCVQNTRDTIAVPVAKSFRYASVRTMRCDRTFRKRWNIVGTEKKKINTSSMGEKLQRVLNTAKEIASKVADSAESFRLSHFEGRPQTRMN